MDIPTADRAAHQDYRFRAPQELQLAAQKPLNVLLIGSCLAVGVAHQLSEVLGHTPTQVTLNYVGAYPDMSAETAASYDFQLIQLPARVLYSEFSYINLKYDEPGAYEVLFQNACAHMTGLLDAALQYNRQHGILTFVSNLITPQQNPMGRLLPRYDLRNPVYFIERLNQHLDSLLGGYKDVYILDVDQISATFGRMYHQDDSLWSLSHGGILAEFDQGLDQGRIEPTAPLAETYVLREFDFLRAVCVELQALYRTARQIDQVKMVVVDLDDTLWRGVVAEDGQFGSMEGWPLGIVEALAFLRERGVVLAIISKNDEATIERLWDNYFNGLLRLDHFAVRKINWRPKADNMAEVLAQANLLPRSVVFVDDNPAERAAMSQAYPDMRILGADLYYLRRVLLWAPETQAPFITDESRGRAQTIQASVQRSAERSTLSREDFLAALALKVTPARIAAPDHPSLPRALELLNRTNQFNTTGKRWTAPELQRVFEAGGAVYAFDVRDRYARYGVTGVAIVAGATIEQFVMSCRVVGLEAELAMLTQICQDLRTAGVLTVTALACDTDVNLLSRDLYPRAGFARSGDRWVKSLDDYAVRAIPDAPAAAEPAGAPAESLINKAKLLYTRLRRPEATLPQRIDHLKGRLSRPR